MESYTVIFLPSGLKVMVEEGSSLQAAARAIGENIETICGGRGSCGKCKVRIIEGFEQDIKSSIAHLAPLTEAEKNYSNSYGLLPDERLACQAKVSGDVVVFVPEESRVNRYNLQKAARERKVDIIPTVLKYFLELPPGVNWDRVRLKLENQFGLHDLIIDPQTQLSLSAILRDNREGITFTLCNDREIIRAEPGRSDKAYGLALDIGTTTIAGYLCDLQSGEIVATESMLNPQIKFGEDVMTRIAYAKDHQNGLAQMNKEIISAVNELVRSVTLQVKLVPKDIAEMVMVGNTVMHHIFLGFDIAPLGLYPFSPAVDHSTNRKASELGLDIMPSANVHTLPIEAAFVGADNVGVMLAEEPYNQDDVLLIIDIGTNGELLLGNRKRLFSASCATGPAFEGGNIKFGMRAAPGAIDRVRIELGTYEVSFSVIGKPEWSAELPAEEIQACGICGSGIIDTMAEMLAAGIINKDGSFNKLLTTPRLRLGQDGKPEFVIAWAAETAMGQDIIVIQKDVRAIQLAMAALSTGSQLMLRRMGRDRPDKVILAGAFGSVIDPRRALALGMFPNCGLENTQAVGNAAGDGARIALLNKEKRIEADRVAREVEYFELTSEPDFNEMFVMATHFPDR